MLIQAVDLRVGDTITTDSDDVAVDAVEIIPDGGLPGQGTTVRYTGRITRGTGRGQRPHTWTKHGDQELDVVRPGVNEEVWHLTPGAKPRRVR